MDGWSRRFSGQLKGMRTKVHFTCAGCLQGAGVLEFRTFTLDTSVCLNFILYECVSILDHVS